MRSAHQSLFWTHCEPRSLLPHHWRVTRGAEQLLALRSVGEQLAALAPQRVLETAGEEPEGQEPQPPRGSRTPVGRQWLVVLRHGQRIDEARSRLSSAQRRLSQRGERPNCNAGANAVAQLAVCSKAPTHERFQACRVRAPCVATPGRAFGTLRRSHAAAHARRRVVPAIAQTSVIVMR